MSVQRRKDNKGRVLKNGESQRKDGTYMYRYTDMRGKRQNRVLCRFKDTEGQRGGVRKSTKRTFRLYKRQHTCH